MLPNTHYKCTVLSESEAPNHYCTYVNLVLVAQRRKEKIQSTAFAEKKTPEKNAIHEYMYAMEKG